MGEKIAQHLRTAGIPVSMLTWKGSCKGAQPDPDSVKIVTWYSSKGLEYPVVAIPGLGYLPHVQKYEAEEVRLAYVAMTRAMDRLIMTCHRESPFVERLNFSGVSLVA